MQRIEAFLIDSNKLFREGLKRLLDDSPFQIVAEAGNLREGVAIVESGLRPQLVLLDLVNGGDDEADLGVHRVDRDRADLDEEIVRTGGRHRHCRLGEGARVLDAVRGDRDQGCHLSCHGAKVSPRPQLPARAPSIQ